jgi:hypothetical protein
MVVYIYSETADVVMRESVSLIFNSWGHTGFAPVSSGPVMSASDDRLIEPRPSWWEAGDQQPELFCVPSLF